MIGLALAAGLFGFSALPAADKPAAPIIGLKVTKQNVVNENAGTERTSTFVTRRSTGNDYFFAIDVRNTGTAAATGLQIEYVVMNRVTRGGSGARKSQVLRTTGSETIEVPAGGTMSIKTKNIKGTNSSTTDQYDNWYYDNAGSGKTVSSTTTQFIGIYVEVKLDGKVVGRHENPTGFKSKMDTLK